MDFLKAFLFERPLYLVPVLVVAQFILIRVWAQRRTAGSRRAAWIGLVVAVLLLAAQRLVVTDRERIIALCRMMALAVEDGDVPAVAAHVADHFDAKGMNKADFVARLTRGLTTVHVERSRLSDFQCTFDNSRHAHVRFLANARVVYGREVALRQPSAWELLFERVGESWQMTSLKPVRIPAFPFDHLSELFTSIGGL